VAVMMPASRHPTPCAMHTKNSQLGKIGNDLFWIITCGRTRSPEPSVYWRRRRHDLADYAVDTISCPPVPHRKTLC